MSLPTPFYQDASVTLYCGDCREIVADLPACDAVITDPPYGETSLDWDVWPKGWPAAALSKTRQLWCFGSMRMFWNQRDEFAAWSLAQDVVWEKHNGSGPQSDRFRRVHELACHFYQGDWSTLYKKPPVVTLESDRGVSLSRGGHPAHFRAMAGNSSYEYDGKRIMRSVIPVRSCHGYAVNETQKPEGIVRPLLEYSVPIGGLVVDLFAGSGTVLAVARQLGMHAIGIEKRESQCQEIVMRLAQGVLVP